MKHYSTDLREAVCRACDAGATVTEVARIFGVSPRSVVRWRAAKRDRGSVETRPRSGRPRLLTVEEEALLGEQVLAHSDDTLAEQAARWETEHGDVVSEATLSRILARQQITRKKRHWSPASKTPTPERSGGLSSRSLTPPQ